MVKNLQLLLAVLIILLIVPQTPTENIVLRRFHDTGFFTSYNESKKFLHIVTWSLIFSFLLITFVLNV